MNFAVKETGGVRNQDCIEGLDSLPAGSIDLVFADPPFNIGYHYDVYDDTQEKDVYVAWCRRWIEAVHRALKPTGTFWLAIGDESAAELKVQSQKAGFFCRSWVIWYYTFGVNCTRKFSRSHAHLFHFVKDRKNFTFRDDDPENRVPSARQLVYADLRANPKGRLPDDTWILRPQELAGCFTASEDTWYFPRVAGTFKERAGFHGCQMPEQLLARIIRTCSAEGELVVDPFSGSATTLVVAKKLGRRYCGFDISDDYVRRGNERLSQVKPGDPLEGAADPLTSAPTIARGKSLQAKKLGKTKPQRGTPSRKQMAIPYHTKGSLAEGVSPELLRGLVDAFQTVSDGFSLDRVVADPDLNEQLADDCRRRGLEGGRLLWNHLLFRLRKSGRLAHLPTTRRTELSWRTCDAFLFASEIALKQMFDGGCHSLDELLCDPAKARKFDEVAARFAPGHTPLEYRWGALKLRKEARLVRSRAMNLTPRTFVDRFSVGCFDWNVIPDSAAVYQIASGSQRKDYSLYVGQTLNLRARLLQHFGDDDRLNVWHSCAESVDLRLRTLPAEPNPTDLLAVQARLVRRHRPKLNLADFLAI